MTIRPRASLTASQLVPQISPLQQHASRSFSRSAVCQKKGKDRGAAAAAGGQKEVAAGGRSKKGQQAEPKEDKPAHGGDKNRPQPNAEDPFDLADVEHSFGRVSEKHEAQLKLMRTGGRFNPDTIGALPVRPDKNAQVTYPLRELAQVVVKGGRTVSIMVSEERLVKPVQSAIMNSEDFNQQPQRAEDNELELLMKVEPERADALVKRAKDILHRWREDVRAERHKRDVVHKKWKDDKVITTDDKRKLDKDLQKLQDARMGILATKEKEVLNYIASREGN